MTYRPVLLAAGLIALLPTGSALAEGLTNPGIDSPAVGSTQDWTGLYLGFAVNTPRGDNAWAARETDLSLVPGGWSGSTSMLTLGHDWQHGRMTFGALLSVGGGEIAASPTSATFISCDICETTVSDLTTLRGRMGFVAGPVHIFASGGFARANATATNLSSLLVVRDTTLHGWTAGVGVEHRIGEKLTLAVSYDHVDLGTMELPDYVPTGHTDVDFGLMTVGMNLRW